MSDSTSAERTSPVSDWPSSTDRSSLECRSCRWQSRSMLAQPFPYFFPPILDSIRRGDCFGRPLRDGRSQQIKLHYCARRHAKHRFAAKVRAAQSVPARTCQQSKQITAANDKSAWRNVETARGLGDSRQAHSSPRQWRDFTDRSSDDAAQRC